MMTFNKLTIIGLVFLLGGCTGMQDDSSCTKIDGIQGCSSMNDVTNMIRQGDIAADNSGNVFRNYGSSDSSSTITNGIAINSLSGGTVNEPPKPSTPMRIGERIINMTIFPFLDEDETYHDTSGVSLLYTKPHWSKPAISKVIQSKVD